MNDLSTTGGGEAYVYDPAPAALDHAAAVHVLRGRVPNPVVDGWPTASDAEHAAMRREIAAIGLGPVPLRLAADDYWDFRRRADYERLEPVYSASTVVEKSFEHFVAMHLLRLDPSATFVDLASWQSPLPRIARRLFGCEAFAQDLMYPPGVNAGRIGGDACRMPVPDGFVSGACLTCSLEHFEADADTRLVQELTRVVRPRGRVVVVPLYLFPRDVTLTDPLVSLAVRVPFDLSTTVHCAPGWGQRHGRYYSPRTLAARVLGPASGAFDVTLFELVRPRDLSASIYAQWVMLLERRA